jgi:hypothetical protein
MSKYLIALVILSLSLQKSTTQGIVNISSSNTTLARQFNGTSDYLTSASGLVPGAPTVFSLAFTLNQASFSGGVDAAAVEWSADFFVSLGSFLVNPTSTSTGDFEFPFQTVASNANGILDCHFARPSAGTYHQYLLVWNVTTSAGTCKGYVGGVSQTVTVANGSAEVAGSLSNASIFFMSRAGTSLFNAGGLTRIALWSADESGNIGSISPCGSNLATVDPGNLQYYWPILQVSPETSGGGGAVNLNVTGTTNVAGPC